MIYVYSKWTTTVIAGKTVNLPEVVAEYGNGSVLDGDATPGTSRVLVAVEGDVDEYRFPRLQEGKQHNFANYKGAMQEAFGKRPDNGVTFTAGGQTLTLPASQGFQDRLTRLLAAYREAGAAGSTSVTIATRNGSRTMTLTQLRAAYKAYMDAAATLNAPLDQVDAAATMADLDAITLQ